VIEGESSFFSRDRIDREATSSVGEPHTILKGFTMSTREVRLLLVDDDPSSIRVMSRMLAQYPDQRFAISADPALARVPV